MCRDESHRTSRNSLKIFVGLTDLCLTNSATPITAARLREILDAPDAAQPTGTQGVKQGRPRLSAAKRSEIAEQYASGKSSLELAKEYGIGKATVLGILRQHNVVVRRREPLKPEQVTQAAQLYEGGQSLEQIAKPLGISAGTIRNALLAAGFKTRPRIGR